MGEFIKVETLANNQYKILFTNCKVFQSYDSIIAIKYKDSEILHLGKDYNYSITTSKYLNKCFGYTAKDCTLALEKGNPNFKMLE